MRVAKTKVVLYYAQGDKMPKSPILAKLVKSDRRKEWTALKTKHKAAIAAKKLDFNAKLGPALDKYQLAVAAANKLFVAEKLSQPLVQKALYAARTLEPIAQTYVSRVKGLGDPAEKELTAFLKAIVADCAGWEQVAVLFDTDDTPMMSASQLAAVKNLYGPLDRLVSQLLNLAKSLPAARAQLKADAPKTKRAAKKGTKVSAAEWAVVAALTEQEWARILKSKVDAVVASADSLAPKRLAVLNDVSPLLLAVTKFDRGSDYGSLKARAQTVAAGSVANFHQAAQAFMALQTDPELRTKLGFDAGLPFIQNTRASKAIDHGRDYAEQLIAAVRQLP
jgi:hypothetical protein